MRILRSYFSWVGEFQGKRRDLTVLPVLHSLKPCFSGAGVRDESCPTWRVSTSESVKASKSERRSGLQFAS